MAVRNHHTLHQDSEHPQHAEDNTIALAVKVEPLHEEEQEGVLEKGVHDVEEEADEQDPADRRNELIPGPVKGPQQVPPFVVVVSSVWVVAVANVGRFREDVNVRQKLQPNHRVNHKEQRGHRQGEPEIHSGQHGSNQGSKNEGNPGDSGEPGNGVRPLGIRREVRHVRLRHAHSLLLK